jgi:hypothetical protein
VVAARGRNLERSPCDRLITDVNKIDGVIHRINRSPNIVWCSSLLGNRNGMSQRRDAGKRHTARRRNS